MTASSQTQTGTQTNTPSQIGYLNTGFSDAQKALGQAQGNNVAPSGFVAQMTPQQLQQYQSIMGYANGNQTAAQQAQLGSQLGTAGSAGVQGALQGYAGFNPSIGGEINAGNQYAAGQNIPAQVQAAMRSANQEATDLTLPGIDSAAAGTGNTNSSRTGVADGIVQRGLAQQAGDISAQLQAGAYNTGAGLQSSNYGQQLAALSGQGGLGLGAAGTGSGALSAGVNDYGNLAGLGLLGASGGQQNQQLGYNNQIASNAFSQQSPFTALQNYMNLLNVNAGGTQTGNQTTTSNPSAMSVIGGLLGTGGSLIGSKPSAYGGGSGLLGMFA